MVSSLTVSCACSASFTSAGLLTCRGRGRQGHRKGFKESSGAWNDSIPPLPSLCRPLWPAAQLCRTHAISSSSSFCVTVRRAALLSSQGSLPACRQERLPPSTPSCLSKILLKKNRHLDKHNCHVRVPIGRVAVPRLHQPCSVGRREGALGQHCTRRGGAGREGRGRSSKVVRDEVVWLRAASM